MQLNKHQLAKQLLKSFQIHQIHISQSGTIYQMPLDIIVAYMI